MNDNRKHTIHWALELALILLGLVAAGAFEYFFVYLPWANGA